MSSTSAVEVSIHAVSPLFGAGASAAQASAGASRAKSAARRLEARANLAAVGIALSLNPVDRMTKRPLRRRSTGFKERAIDRKSTRLNSSHLGISYAVFCL